MDFTKNLSQLIVTEIVSCYIKLLAAKFKFDGNKFVGYIFL